MILGTAPPVRSGTLSASGVEELGLFLVLVDAQDERDVRAFPLLLELGSGLNT